MANDLNPAGRLHGLLSQFGAKENMSIQAAWASVLEVPEADLAMRLGAVASLLQDVRDAAQETQNPAFGPIPEHLNVLSRSILPVDTALHAGVSDVLPNAQAMQMLHTLSAFLDLMAPEGRIPEQEELDELREGVGELIEEMTGADLPPDIRRALLHRLGDVLAALDHLKVGGPDAVRRAAEALATSTILCEEAVDDDSSLFTRIKLVAKKTWLAFTIATTLANAALTWDRITGVQALSPAQEVRQLPPGSGGGTDEDDDSAPTHSERN